MSFKEEVQLYSQLYTFFHVTNRMFHGPVSDSIEISTSVMRIQLRPRQWISLQHVEREYSDIRIALNILSQHLQTMI